MNMCECVECGTKCEICGEAYPSNCTCPSDTECKTCLKGNWQECVYHGNGAKSCDEDKRELRACDCGQGQHKMIICLDCDDVLERDCEAGVLKNG